MVTARDKGGDQDFEPVPEGMTHGICFGVFDLGTQYSEKFGKAHKCVIQWEVPEHRNDFDGEDTARHVSRIFTVSLHSKSNLRPFLESWRGKKFSDQELTGFNLKKLLGVNAELQLMHEKKGEKTYTNVTNAIPYRGEKQNPERNFLYFSFEDEDSVIPDETVDWIVKMIEDAEEWNPISKSNRADDQNWSAVPDDDNIPF